MHNVIETSKLEAREEGIVMGREEGIVIGKKEGIKSLVLKLSSRKLGEIPNSIQQKINQLSTDLAPDGTDLTIVADPITGVTKKKLFWTDQAKARLICKKKIRLNCNSHFRGYQLL